MQNVVTKKNYNIILDVCRMNKIGLLGWFREFNLLRAMCTVHVVVKNLLVFDKF